MNADKLAKLQSQVRIGGKGTQRRKVKKVQKSSNSSSIEDTSKLQSTLKKLNVQDIQGVEEVNMFYKSGQIINFSNPKVQASIASNTFVINGYSITKELSQLLPGILTQLGPESLTQLKKLADKYTADQALKSKTAAKINKSSAIVEEIEEEDDDDDDIPELVDAENFDEDQ